MDQFINVIQIALNSLQDIDIKPTEKNVQLLLGSYQLLKQVQKGLKEYKPDSKVEDDKKAEENQNGTE